MPLFNFNTGPDPDGTGTSGATVSVSFTDNGVPFVLSTTANPGGGFVDYDPGNGIDNGAFLVGESGVPGVLTLDVGTANGTLTNFAATGGNITLVLGSFISGTGTWSVTFVNENGTAPDQTFANVSGDQVLSFATSQTYSHIQFTYNGSGLATLSVDSLNASIVCYLEGTGIDTAQGRVLVEDLRPGDRILTAKGGETTVKWVGTQPVDTRLTHPAKVNPIRIAAGALAEGVPARDLYVSPDHAIALDGLLVNASALTNGTTITMVPKMPASGFTYYHVETDAHELILAEGCAAESYLDMPDRSAFANGGERADAEPIAEMNMPRITTRRLLPQETIARLQARAEALAARAIRAA